MEDIFDSKIAQNYIDRISSLTKDSQPLWGRMSVDQMLAHCNVTYELIYEPEKHKKPSGITKFILKTFVKSKVVSETPYKQNIPTGPQFKIVGNKDFDLEKKRLIGFIQKTQQLGRNAFNGKESSSFGSLKSDEWNNMFVKHLNHHLKQFAV